ncbi:hypothetical protein [Haloplanus salinus]|uniref:hypothetical protein n=1 Tax=Haloplanus salinus TaxID=1126245 RepID=UPI0011C066B1|nr:hypothetical protein [Haloplanus salinus]
MREPIQNALDTGSDLDVQVDYGDRSVVVEDYDPEGVEDLSRFYDLFSGSKQHDPEKRGRFGRGVKEFIGATDETVISSTGGGLRFSFDTVYDEVLDEYQVESSREMLPGVERERGTMVYGSNSDWTQQDLEQVEDFISDLWMPRDRELVLETFRPYSEKVMTGEEPDATLENQYLPTIVFDEGVQKEKHRSTPVEVNKTEPGEGGIYEMGIPVTRGEEFPFLFNVHQKTPVTERRNELDNSYRSDLMRSLLDNRLDLLDDEELEEEYVTQYISQFSHKTSEDTQQEYISRRFGNDPDNLLVYSDSTPNMAVTWAVQRQLPMEKLNEYSRNISGILDNQCPSVQEWFNEQNSERAIDPVETPGEAQEDLIQYFEEEILGRSSADDVDFELAYISEDSEEGQTHATYSPVDETIYLNALADDWSSPTPSRIGTALHEIGHHETDPNRDGHGPRWYHAVEELSGEVIQNLEQELEDLE